MTVVLPRVITAVQAAGPPVREGIAQGSRGEETYLVMEKQRSLIWVGCAHLCTPRPIAPYCQSVAKIQILQISLDWNSLSQGPLNRDALRHQVPNLVGRKEALCRPACTGNVPHILPGIKKSF